MRRTWLSALAVCSACSFEGTSSLLNEGTAPPDGGAALVACDSTDTTLSLCLEFEDPQPTTMARDGSSFHNDANVKNLTMMSGHSAEAALLTSSSSIIVPAKPELSPSEAISFELWLQPDEISFDDWGLFDNDGEYGMKLLGTGEIRCVIGTTTIDRGLIGPDGSWHHAACVYDQMQGSLQVFVDGQLAGCKSLTHAISTDSDSGLAIGALVDDEGELSEHFHGGVDSVKVYTRALDPDEVCTEAGRTNCIDTCL